MFPFLDWGKETSNNTNNKNKNKQEKLPFNTAPEAYQSNKYVQTPKDKKFQGFS